MLMVKIKKKETPSSLALLKRSKIFVKKNNVFIKMTIFIEALKRWSFCTANCKMTKENTKA